MIPATTAGTMIFTKSPESSLSRQQEKTIWKWPPMEKKVLAVEPEAVVDGDRVLGAPGRYRLHVRYSREAGVEFDSMATTDPIEIA